MKRYIFLFLLLAACQKEDSLSVIKEITIPIESCNDGLFVRWYYNGWNYELFSNRFTTTQESKVSGTQIVEKFSAISKVEKNTSRENKVNVVFGKENIPSDSIQYYKGLLIAETVQIYQLQRWSNIEIDRSNFTIRPTKLNRYKLEAKAYVKELLSDSLIVPPIEIPTSQLIIDELFANWTGAAPYDQHPTLWTIYRNGSNAISWVEPNANGLKFTLTNAAGNVRGELGYILPSIMSGSFKITVNVYSTNIPNGGRPIYLKSYNSSWAILNTSVLNRAGSFTQTISSNDFKAIKLIFGPDNDLAYNIWMVIKSIKIEKIL